MFKIKYQILFLLLSMSSLQGASTNYLPNTTSSAAFYNSLIVTLQYTGQSSCQPILTSLFHRSAEIRNASNATNCEMGVQGSTLGAYPIIEIIPAFAGMSIFGNKFGKATADGFPLFANNTIITNCGPGESNSICAGNEKLLYSPLFSSIEQAMNFSVGSSAYPLGVLPAPARDLIISNDYNGISVQRYVVDVYVFDPNIFPNATTGQCKQIFPSNLSNATSNCLTSLSALQAAIQTTSNTVQNINKDNIIWKQFNGNTTANAQVAIYPIYSLLSNTNTNIRIPLYVTNKNYYGTKQPHTSTTTTTIQQAIAPPALGIAAKIGTYVTIALLILFIAWIYNFISSKKRKGQIREFQNTINKGK